MRILKIGIVCLALLTLSACVPLDDFYTPRCHKTYHTYVSPDSSGYYTDSAAGGYYTHVTPPGSKETYYSGVTPRTA